MNIHPELIVMLTHNDQTVENAREVFESCKNSKARFWGFKEEPLLIQSMKELYSIMKECGKTTFLEVVAYDEEECLAGANTAVECGVDVLLGTMYSDSVNELCKEHGLKYMPFVGTVTGRPSVLEGRLEDMIAEAQKALEKGVYGFDLLGYRYTGDATALNKAFVEAVDAPVSALPAASTAINALTKSRMRLRGPSPSAGPFSKESLENPSKSKSTMSAIT